LSDIGNKRTKKLTNAKTNGTSLFGGGDDKS